MRKITDTKLSDTKKTLLLVEDEPFIAMNETLMLEKFGYTVITAHSGEKAIQSADEMPIDLILMDIDLGNGKLDGTEAAQRILAEHNLPIIFLTNRSETKIVEKVKGITRYGYLLKNSGEFVFMEAISMAFELFNANQRMHAEAEERQQAQLALEESLQISHDIVDSIPAGLFIYHFKEPNFLYLLAGNPESERLTGINLDTSIGKEFNEIWPNAQETGVTDAFLRAYKTGETFESDELFYQDEHISGAFRVRVFKMPRNQLGVAFENISEAKKAETELKESEERFRSVVQMARDAIVVCNFDDSIIFWNAGAEHIFGYSSKEMTGSTVERIIPEGFRSRYETELRKRAEIGSPAIDASVREFKALRKDGREILVERSISTWEVNGQGFVTRIYRDITQRKKEFQALQKTNAELKKAVQEKEYLLQEINHRVKNNLTMISALFRLKASSLKDSIDLSDLEHQITAIRIVHDKLYQSDRITHIDLKLYTQELLETIFSSFTERHVQINNTIQSTFIPTKQAVSLGLIFNEAATNAIKHGFTENKSFEFAIDLKKDQKNKEYVFTISNSGNPVPESVNIDHPETLGLKIISMLVEQLEGKVELEKKPHPEITIRIPQSVLQIE